MKFSVQHYSEDPALMDELLPMLNAWGKEVLTPGKFGLRTNRVLDLWKRGIMVLILARREDTSALVGFHIWWLYEPVYVLEKRAVSGPLYIDPNYRGTFSIDLAEYGMQAVRILGAETVIIEWDTENLPSIDRALEYLGSRAKIVATYIQVEK